MANVPFNLAPVFRIASRLSFPSCPPASSSRLVFPDSRGTNYWGESLVPHLDGGSFWKNWESGARDHLLPVGAGALGPIKTLHVAALWMAIEF
jgi:hypothetical protein